MKTSDTRCSLSPRTVKSKLRRLGDLPNRLLGAIQTGGDYEQYQRDRRVSGRAAVNNIEVVVKKHYGLYKIFAANEAAHTLATIAGRKKTLTVELLEMARSLGGTVKLVGADVGADPKLLAQIVGEKPQ